MTVCSRHNCVHNGVCEACGWERRCREAEADLHASRAMMIDAERKLEIAERDLQHAQARIEALESA